MMLQVDPIAEKPVFQDSLHDESFVFVPCDLPDIDIPKEVRGERLEIGGHFFCLVLSAGCLVPGAGVMELGTWNLELCA